MRKKTLVPSIAQWTPIEVQWVDSIQEKEWESDQYIEIEEVPTIASVGYFFKELDDQVVLIQSHNIDVRDGKLGQIDSILQIPKCSITRVIVLKQIQMYGNKKPKAASSKRRKKGR